MWAASTRGPVGASGTLPGQADSRRRLRRRRTSRSCATPNVPTITDADLVEQFTLAKAISDKVTVANEAVLRIRSLKEQIGERAPGRTPTRRSRPPARR